MMAPPMSQARMPRGILPPVRVKMVCALKNTPDPMTMPTTMHMAVNRPYFRFNLLSIRTSFRRGFHGYASLCIHHKAGHPRVSTKFTRIYKKYCFPGAEKKNFSQIYKILLDGLDECDTIQY